MPEKTGGKQTKSRNKGKFAQGRSGNPKGRPTGARNKATLIAEKLLDGEAKEITNTCIAMAKAGDSTALRLSMERLLPPRKGRPVCVKLPQIGGAMDIVEAHAAVLAAASSGNITLEEASMLSSLIDGCRKAIELTEIEQRLIDLEKGLGRWPVD